ncbi:MAG TPA: sulfur carrier protein ThiS [Deferrisomatales bacterium]|nr:sulfur carrier protein ThiS [Deferrisomatales bacterium]
MKVSINGRLRMLPAGTSLARLLQELELEAARVVVERNRSIVPREEFAAVALGDGDVLEIVHFVGGG